MTRWRRLHTMLTILAIMTLMADDSIPLTPGDHRRGISAGGLEREYFVHVPPGYDGSKSTPVVLIFHGGLSNANQMTHFCGLNDKADEAGFIAVYPNGTGLTEVALTWNAGN